MPPKPSTPAPSSASAPEWVGAWRVRRYNGERPSVPTFYRATPNRWDVIKDTAPNRHVAPHPILEVRDDILLLKDEGEADANAERWRVEVQDDTLRVTSLTGPHEGAVGIADRLDTALSEVLSDAPPPETK